VVHDDCARKLGGQFQFLVEVERRNSGRAYFENGRRILSQDALPQCSRIVPEAKRLFVADFDDCLFEFERANIEGCHRDFSRTSGRRRPMCSAIVMGMAGASAHHSVYVRFLPDKEISFCVFRMRFRMIGKGA
jgi:hypothetical protein